MLDLGFVGELVEVDRTLLDLLAQSEMIPVIAPVAPGRDGHTYNINADTFAGAIAGALGATRLLFLTDVPGVLDKDKNLIKELSVPQAQGADRRRHDLGRHDPQGRDLHRGGGDAASRASSSSTARPRMRCCSNCSPSMVPAR